MAKDRLAARLQQVVVRGRIVLAPTELAQLGAQRALREVSRVLTPRVERAVRALGGELLRGNPEVRARSELGLQPRADQRAEVHRREQRLEHRPLAIEDPPGGVGMQAQLATPEQLLALPLGGRGVQAERELLGEPLLAAHAAHLLALAGQRRHRLDLGRGEVRAVLGPMLEVNVQDALRLSRDARHQYVVAERAADPEGQPDAVQLFLAGDDRMVRASGPQQPVIELGRSLAGGRAVPGLDRDHVRLGQPSRAHAVDPLDRPGAIDADVYGRATPLRARFEVPERLHAPAANRREHDRVDQWVIAGQQQVRRLVLAHFEEFLRIGGIGRLDPRLAQQLLGGDRVGAERADDRLGAWAKGVLAGLRGCDGSEFVGLLEEPRERRVLDLDHHVHPVAYAPRLSQAADAADDLRVDEVVAGDRDDPARPRGAGHHQRVLAQGVADDAPLVPAAR